MWGNFFRITSSFVLLHIWYLIGKPRNKETNKPLHNGNTKLMTSCSNWLLPANNKAMAGRRMLLGRHHQLSDNPSSIYSECVIRHVFLFRTRQDKTIHFELSTSQDCFYNICNQLHFLIPLWCLILSTSVRLFSIHHPFFYVY